MNKSIKILINYFLGPIILVILCYSLYNQLLKQVDLSLRWQQIKESWYNMLFLNVIILMFLNWSVEAKKWQILVAHIQSFSFLTALKSVLSGCSITMLTPNRIGEYGGRVLFLNEENRLKGISLTIVGSISQLLITMIMGCCGLFFLRFFSQNTSNALTVLPHFWGDVLIYLSVTCTIILFLFYIRIGWLVKLLEKIPAFNKIVTHISVLDEFETKQLVQILLLSLLRYFIFVFQYVLLMQLLKVGINITLSFWLVTVFYLVMAVAPTIGFLELPIRAKASLEIMQLYSSNNLGIQTVALGIWIINLVIPALLGSILILGIKIVKEK